jgi:hypothetical protein
MSNLVFTRVGNDMMIGGYIVPNKLDTITFNASKEENNMQTGGNVNAVSSVFKGLAVPAGLFLLQQNVSDKPVTDSIELVKRDVIDGKLYDELLDMVTLKDKRRFIKNTRKQKRKQNKKTRKSR